MPLICKHQVLDETLKKDTIGMLEGYPTNM